MPPSWRHFKVQNMSDYYYLWTYPRPPTAGFNYIWGNETRFYEGRDPYRPVSQTVAVQSRTLVCRF